MVTDSADQRRQPAQPAEGRARSPVAPATETPGWEEHVLAQNIEPYK